MTCCARVDRRASTALLVFFLLMAAGVAPALAKGKKGKKTLDADALFNPLLGVEYSHWLVGPIYHMLDEADVERYLALASDEEAQAFIEAFWAEHNADTPIFKDSPETIFRARVVEADKRFTEAVYPGSRTARGIRFVLYGEPESITFDEPEVIGDPTPEVWTYPKDASPGLDGVKPERRYRFVKDGEFTVLYNEHLRRKQRSRNNLERRRLP